MNELLATPPQTLRSAAGSDLLPNTLSYRERFQFAADAGFEGVEIWAVENVDEAEEIREAALGTGIRIHSVKSPLTYECLLTDPNRETVRKGIRAFTVALENAQRWESRTVLVPPAVVSRRDSYLDAYRRSQAVIKSELLPIARDLKVILAIENIWNGILLSPIEFARYVDELDSPWARSCLDIGNVIFGHPEHWIRILGNRIVSLHIRDFHFNERWKTFGFARIGDGDIDWPAVLRALDEVGFSGWATNTGMPPGHLVTNLLRRGLVRLNGGESGGRLRFLRLEKLGLTGHRRSLRDAARRFDDFRSGKIGH